MADKLIVSEHIASVWKSLMIYAAILAVIFFCLFLFIAPPLWSGIFRLFAFVNLVIFVLAVLQMRGRTKKIKLEVNYTNLIVNYYLSTDKNQEESFELKTIKRIKQVPADAVWGIFPRKDCVKFNIIFTDTESSLSLLRFQGRNLFVSHEDALKLEHFIHEVLKSKSNSNNQRAGNG